MKVHKLIGLGINARCILFERDVDVGEIQSDVRDTVEYIYRESGIAVREFSNEFDGIQVGNIDVTDATERAYDEIDDDVYETIKATVANVRELHEKQVLEDWHEEFGDAGAHELGCRYHPLDRVGVYVPGDTAVYPSSVLMGAIPAKITEAEHVVVVTPPVESINPVILAATHVVGADTVYSINDVQGIVAFVYGMETVKAVQKVVGPGSKWVTAAKAEVRGDVNIDFLVDPFEVLIVADETAEARFVAVDLVAQAEHGPNVSVVAVANDANLAAKVVTEVERQTDERERMEIIEATLEGDASGVFLARSVSEVVLFAKEYTAEHLTIQADDDEALLDRIDSAGSVPLGPHTPVAVGDYTFGTNHVPPTGGGVKRQGGLPTNHFVRPTTVQRPDRDELSELSETVTTLAGAGGLDARAQSVRERFGK